MARALKVAWSSSHYAFGQDDGIRIRFEVECANEISSKVFAYRMLPQSPNGNSNGHYSHVCSPVDLEEYPEDGPTAGASPEWFRLSYVDVLVRSVEEAESFIEAVRSDLHRLLRTLSTMDTIMPQGLDELGAICLTGDESSSSSSASLSQPSSSSSGSLQVITAEATAESSTGSGVAWIHIGEGAGTGVLGSDSDSMNRSRVTLYEGQASQLLLVQGFDLSGIPKGATIEGIRARLVIRDFSSGHPSSSSGSDSASNSSSSSDSESPQCPRLAFVALQHPAYGLGDNLGDYTCIEGPDWQTLEYGGEFDMWGLSSLTAENLLDGSFGLGLVVANAFDTPESVTEVDGVELDVFFRE